MAEVTFYILAGFGLGTVTGAAGVWLYLSRRRAGINREMEYRFKLTAQEAVQHAHESFLQRAEETLLTWSTP